MYAYTYVNLSLFLKLSDLHRGLRVADRCLLASPAFRVVSCVSKSKIYLPFDTAKLDKKKSPQFLGAIW